MDDEYGDVIAEFLIESFENIDRLVQDLLALEENPRESSTLSSAFRNIHTIKGTCGFLGYGKLERVTHVGETLLSHLRDGELELDPSITTALLEMVDAVRAMLESIESTGTDGDDAYPALVATLERLTHGDDGAASTAAAPAAAAATPLIGEILVEQGAVDPADVERAVLAQLDDGKVPPPAPSPDGRVSLSESTIRVDVGVLDRLMNLVGELVLSRNNIVQHVGSDGDPMVLAASQQLDLVTGELQECVMKTRMQPIGTVWSKFTRVVRDLAVQCGKQVRIETDGEETELDKTILEAIKDPLTHVVRNTVDHGIEGPEQRLAIGKPAEGVLRMRAHHEGGQVLIEITDDGAGIDPERVKAKALGKGLITPQQARAMSDRDAIALIFAPGFSTAEAVTNVSGRGVGMDVVKTNIERIGGSVEVESEVGVGTSLTVKIPLTLAIVPAVMIRCRDQDFAIPQIEVHELVRLDGEQVAAEVEMVHNAAVHRLRGDLLPLVHLRDVLGFDPAPEGSTLTIAVVSSENRMWGLVVDGVSTTEEIVVKPLGRILRSVPAFSGASIMGDGRVSLILDIARIAKQCNVVAAAENARQHGTHVDESETGTRVKLLVVARGEQQLAVDLSDVDRLEQFDPADIERSGDLDVVQYRDGILPLVSLLPPGLDPDGGLTAIVFARRGRLVGLVVERIVDIVEATVDATAEGHARTVVVRERVTDLLELDSLLATADVWAGRTHHDRELTEVSA